MMILNIKRLVVLSFLCLFSSMSLFSIPAFAEAEKSGEAVAAKPAMKVESALEKKVRSLANLLRCPVCQGESVYDSHSEVAVEMKSLIAEKIQAGETDQQILTYFKDRYGNFILMEPPHEGIHWVIWIFPGFMGLLGALFLFQNLRNSTRASDSRDADEGAKLKKDDELRSMSEIEELHL